MSELTKAQLKRLTAQSEILKALAHPQRLAILALLGKDEFLSVTAIHEALGMEQALASHHLGILKNKGILKVTRDGRNSLYALRYPCLTQIFDCLDQCKRPAL
jgi:DNA-binding transcriptional ArsR family regulator